MTSDPLPTAAVLATCSGDEAKGWGVRTGLCTIFGLTEDGSAAPWQRLGVWTTALVMREVPGYTAAVARWAQAARGNATADNHWATTVAYLTPPEEPPPTLAITARRYVAFTPMPGAFDLAAGVAVARIPDDWVETTVINLRTLYAACEARARQWTPPRPPSGPTPTPRPSASSPSG